MIRILNTIHLKFNAMHFEFDNISNLELYINVHNNTLVFIFNLMSAVDYNEPYFGY